MSTRLLAARIIFLLAVVYCAPVARAQPSITSLTAADPDNLDAVFGTDDTITVVFDQATNQGGLSTVLTQDNVDSLFTFSETLGAGYSGQWTDALTCVITITDARNGNPTIGSLTATAKSAANGGVDILLADGSGNPSVSTSPALTGDWGTKAGPAISSLVASDPDNLDAVYSTGDAIVVTFDTNTNKAPNGNNALSQSDLDTLFTFSTSLGTAYSGSWDTAGQVLTITIDTAASTGPTINTDTFTVKSAANLKDSQDSSLASTSSATITGDWGTKAGPSISSVVAADPDNADAVYSNGDTFTINFADATNQPAASTKTEIDNVFTFSQVLGTTYTGSWASSSQLVITVSDITGNGSPAVGTFTVTVKSSGNLKDASETWLASTSTSPVLTGDYGTLAGPVISSIKALDIDGQDAIFGNGDNIIVQFDSNTNQPTVNSKAALDLLFTFSQSLGADYTGTWQAADNLLINIVDSTGNGNPIVGTFTMQCNDGVNLLNTAGDSLLSCTQTSPVLTGSWGSKVGPAISSITAGGSGQGYSDGDTITIVFDADTNKANLDTMTKAQLDAQFTFSASLGSAYTGAWSDAKTLVITVSSTTGHGYPELGVFTISPIDTGSTGLMNAAGTEVVDTTASSALAGSWGTAMAAPTISSLVANDPDDANIAYDVLDTVTINFDSATNMPAVSTKAEIDAQFTFSTSIGDDYTGSWSDRMTLLISITTAATSGPSIGGLTVSCASGTTLKSGDGSSAACSSTSPSLSGNWGLTCSECPIGSYRTSTMASCVACPAGYECSDQAVDPVACGAGTFSNGSAIGCTVCADGYYQSSTAQSGCLTCPTGKDCSDKTAPADCAAGTYSSGGQLTCTACATGTYQPSTGQSSCLSCPAGSSCTTTAATSCTSGYYQTGGNSGCSQCPAGYYCPTTTASPLLCVNGTYSEAGSTSCLNCPTGMYCYTPDASPLPCPAGTYNPGGAPVETCLACGAGEYTTKTGSASCSVASAGTYVANKASNPVSCPAGTSSIGNVDACTACLAGEYAPGVGYTGCLSCPAGKYCSDPTSDPVDCSVGFYSPGGQANCTACPVGTQSRSDLAACETCPDGYSCLDPTAGAQLCPAGYYSSNSTDVSLACTPCPAGSRCPSGSSLPVLCEIGTYSGVAASSCTSCPAGYTCPTVDAAPVRCEFGTYSTRGEPYCLECPAGSSCSAPENTPSVCPSGSYALVNSTTCTTCPAGSSCATTSEAPVACTQGQYALSGSTSCEACPAGSTCTTPASSPQACDFGQYSPTLNDTCTDCPEGYMCPSPSDDPVECFPGYFAIGRQTNCTACPAGYACSDPASNVMTKCVEGSYATGGVTSCTVCPAGFYCPSITQSLEIACPNGTYSYDGQNNCTACPQGWECPMANGAQNLPCIAGSYSPGMMESCIDCPSGYRCTDSQAIACDAGTFATPRSTECTSCPAGYACPSTNKPDMEPCYGGSFSTGNQTSCTVCPTGVYCPSLTTGEMIPCENGTYSLGARQQCIVCPAGQYCPSKHEPPLQCPVGTYSYAMSTECTQCPPGHSCYDPAIPPQPCLAGEYSYGGTVNCSNCDYGFTCPEGSTSPNPSDYTCVAGGWCDGRLRHLCPAGTYGTVSQGVSEEHACQVCPAGSYCVAGSTSAATCPAGYYCPEGTHYSTEFPCDYGTYNPSTGSSSIAACQECAAGTYCSEGSSSQSTCPAGHWCTARTPAYNSFPCPAGTYSASTGAVDSSVCTTCPAGYYCEAGSAQATPCPAGTVNPDMGSGFKENCRFCPARMACPEIAMTSTSVACSAGHYCPSGTALPDEYPCLPGTMTDRTDLAQSEECTTCPEKYACTWGTTGFSQGNPPVACSTGHYCPAGTTLETEFPCDPGTYTALTTLVSQSECSICDAGSYCSGGGATVTGACAAGHYCPAGTQRDTQFPCPAGTWTSSTSLTAASECDACPEGFFCPEGSSAPTGCYEGTYTGQTNTQSAGPGDYPSCQSCTAGHFCNGSTITPYECGLGQYSAAGAGACTTCEAGHFCDSTTTTESDMVTNKQCGGGILCPAGMTRNGTFTDEPCPTGHYCPTATATAINCPVGTRNLYTGKAHLSDCEDCPAGFYCIESTVNVTGLCAPGYYCPAGSYGENQLACPGGTYRSTSMAAAESDCSTCPMGYYCPSGSVTPVECWSGYYCPVGVSIPKPCPLGTYGNLTLLTSADECTPCPGGEYCDGSGRTTTTGKCDPGYYCSGRAYTAAPQEQTPPGWTHASVGGICPRGNYCPLASSAPTPCPAGTFLNDTGGRDILDCGACTAGYYCQGLGNVGPVGECQAGYYCPGGDAMAASVITPVGTFTLAGASQPEPCEPGTYQDTTGQSTCKTCPAGFLCSNQTTSVLVSCPVGYYCPAGSSVGTACPMGTYGALEGLATESDCTSCTPGSYCRENGLSQPTGSCIAGHYCSGGASIPGPVALSSGDRCPAGHYCPIGSSSPVPCPPGTYGNAMGLEDINGCMICPSGKHCSSSGLLAPEGDCSAGYYCNEGSQTSTPSGVDMSGSCGSLRLDGSSTYATVPSAVQLETDVSVEMWVKANAPYSGEQYVFDFSDANGNDNIALAFHSSTGIMRLVVSNGVAQTVSGCAAGYCLEYSGSITAGAWTHMAVTVSSAGVGAIYIDGRLASNGTIAAPRGSIVKAAQNIGRAGATAAGYLDGVVDQIMVWGRVLSSDEIVYHRFGTISSATSLLAHYDIGATSYGVLVDALGANNATVSGTDTRMSSCPGGVFGGPCPVGHSCSSGSSVPSPCAAGTYQDSTGMSSCKTCPAGYYCDRQASAPVACSAGTFCVEGTSSSSIAMCPIGTYSNKTALTAEAECTDCPGGEYCAGVGNTAPDGNCLEGYYCGSRSTTATGESTVSNGVGGVCPEGHYCPTGSTAPVACPSGTYLNGTGAASSASCITCPAGSYCASAGLPTPTGLCSAGYYCVGGSMTPTPTDGTVGNICPAGSFCPMGSTAAQQCPVGTYQASQGSSDCLECPAGYYCSGGSSSFEANVCPAGFYCPAGTEISTAYPCPIGTYSSLTGRTNLTDCASCPAGQYCPDLNATAPAGGCLGGYYCRGGSYSSTPTDGQYGGRCPAGTYCPVGVEAPQSCTAGQYCATEQLEAPTGTCAEGYYCKIGSTTATPSSSCRDFTCTSVALDGMSSYIHVPSSVQLAGDVSVEMWVYANDPFMANVTLFDFSDSSSANNVVLYLAGTTAMPRLIVSDGTNMENTGSCATPNCIESSINLSKLRWVHVAVTIAAPTVGASTALATIYMDGTSVASGSMSFPANVTRTMQMIGRSAASGRYFGGNVDSVRIWSRGLSAAEVLNNMDAPPTDTTNLDAEYNLNAGAGTRAVDAANGRDATLMSTSWSSECPPASVGDVCPAGFYCPAGSSSPSPCSIGTFSGTNGAYNSTVCETCTPGYYCANTGGSTPTGLCSAGYYCAAGQTTPTPSSAICPAGSMCPAGSVEPVTCNNGTYQDQQGMGSCKTCPEGYYCDSVDTTTPQGCPAGYYCPAGTAISTESPCPMGTYSNTTMVTSLSQCQPCPPGQYCGALGLTTSSGPCSPGYYCKSGASTPSPTDGVTGNVCPAGFYCPEGAETELPCRAGTFSPSQANWGEANCTLCPAGTWFDGSGQTAHNGSEAWLCDAGYVCTGGSNTPTPTTSTGHGYICPVGKYCPMGTTTELDCEMGTYNPSQGQGSCTLCPEGFVCASTGMTAPTDCPAGYYCPVNTSIPTGCPAGTYGASTNLKSTADCTQCPAGKYCDGTTLTAPTGDCAAGYLCAGGAATSSPAGSECPAGSYCAAGVTVAEPCPVGSYSATSGLVASTECTPCTGGNYCNVTGLTAPAGPCDAGFYCSEGSTSSNPVSCPQGSYCPSGSQGPVGCPDGEYQSSMGASSCITCPSGYMCANNATTPADCPLANYCPAGTGAAAGVSCPDGSYGQFTNLDSANGCSACPENKYCTAGQVQGDCSAGFYCATNSSTPTPASGENGVTNNGPCPEYSYCLAGQSPTICPNGTYLDAGVTGQTKEGDCLACPSGSSCNNGRKSSSSCASGYYCAEGLGPQPCPVGTFFSGTGATSINDCQNCTAGYWCKNEATTTPQYVCPAGHYCPTGLGLNGETSAIPCPAGTYRSDTGGQSVSDCWSCPGGSYCNNGSAIATSCPTTYYCPPESHVAQVCPGGSYCPGNTTYPIPCPATKYCPQGASAPTVCTVGHYCPGPTTTGGEYDDPFWCGYTYNATTGIFQPTWHDLPGFPFAGSTAQEQNDYCALGDAEPILCPLGTYWDSTASNKTTMYEVCQPCGAGTYGADENRVSCATCDAGYICEAGVAGTDSSTYQVGATVANPTTSTEGGYICPVGHYCPAGATAPVACPAGTFNDATGGTSIDNCVTCPSSTYNTLTGQEGCLACGPSAQGTADRLSCECIGNFRTFLARTSECLCNPGYEFIDSSFQVAPDEDGTVNCQRVIYPLCGTNEELDTDGVCRATTYSCPVECLSGSGTFLDSTGVCECDGVTPNTQLCDDRCKRESYDVVARSTTSSAGTSIELEVTNPQSTTSSTIALRSDSYGQMSCPTGKDCEVLFTYMTVDGFNGIYTDPCYGAEGYLNDILSGTVPAAVAANCPGSTILSEGSSGFKTMGVDASIEGKMKSMASLMDSYPNLRSTNAPIICLNNYGTMVWDLSLGTTHYPVYEKGSLLNTNADFDYGIFRALDQRMRAGTNTTMFAVTFDVKGTYVFSDAANTNRRMTLRVTGAGEACPGTPVTTTTTNSVSTNDLGTLSTSEETGGMRVMSASVRADGVIVPMAASDTSDSNTLGSVMPVTQSALTAVGVTRTDDILTDPDWALIGSLIGAFVLMIIITVVLIQVLQKRKWKARPAEKPGYRKEALAFDFDSFASKGTTTHTRLKAQKLGFSVLEAEGGAGGRRQIRDVGAGALEGGAGGGAGLETIADEFWDYERQVDLEAFSVPQLYNKLADQRVTLDRQMDEHRGDMKDYYDKLTNQTEQLKDLLAAKLEKLGPGSGMDTASLALQCKAYNESEIERRKALASDLEPVYNARRSIFKNDEAKREEYNTAQKSNQRDMERMCSQVVDLLRSAEVGSHDVDSRQLGAINEQIRDKLRSMLLNLEEEGFRRGVCLDENNGAILLDPRTNTPFKREDLMDNKDRLKEIPGIVHTDRITGLMIPSYDSKCVNPRTNETLAVPANSCLHPVTGRVVAIDGNAMVTSSGKIVFALGPKVDAAAASDAQPLQKLSAGDNTSYLKKLRPLTSDKALDAVSGLSLPILGRAIDPASGKALPVAGVGMDPFTKLQTPIDLHGWTTDLDREAVVPSAGFRYDSSTGRIEPLGGSVNNAPVIPGSTVTDPLSGVEVRVSRAAQSPDDISKVIAVGGGRATMMDTAELESECAYVQSLVEMNRVISFYLGLVDEYYVNKDAGVPVEQVGDFFGELNKKLNADLRKQEGIAKTLQKMYKTAQDNVRARLLREASSLDAAGKNLQNLKTTGGNEGTYTDKASVISMPIVDGGKMVDGDSKLIVPIISHTTEKQGRGDVVPLGGSMIDPLTGKVVPIRLGGRMIHPRTSQTTAITGVKYDEPIAKVVPVCGMWGSDDVAWSPDEEDLVNSEVAARAAYARRLDAYMQEIREMEDKVLGHVRSLTGNPSGENIRAGLNMVETMLAQIENIRSTVKREQQRRSQLADATGILAEAASSNDEEERRTRAFLEGVDRFWTAMRNLLSRLQHLLEMFSEQKKVLDQEGAGPGAYKALQTRISQEAHNILDDFGREKRKIDGDLEDKFQSLDYAFGNSNMQHELLKDLLEEKKAALEMDQEGPAREGGVGGGLHPDLAKVLASLLGLPGGAKIDPATGALVPDSEARAMKDAELEQMSEYEREQLMEECQNAVARAADDLSDLDADTRAKIIADSQRALAQMEALMEWDKRRQEDKLKDRLANRRRRRNEQQTESDPALEDVSGEELKSRHIKEQRDLVDKLNESSKSDLDDLEYKMDQEKQRILDETRAAFINSLPDNLSEDERRRLIAEHEKSMERLESLLDQEKGRQSGALKDKLADRKRRRLEAQRGRHAAESQSVALREKQEEDLAALTKKHTGEMKDLQSDIGGENNAEVKKAMDQIARQNERAISELKARQSAELSDPRLTDSEKAALLKKHARELESLEDSLESDKLRQEKALRNRLNDRKRKRMEALKAKQDGEVSMLLKDQEAERDQLYASLPVIEDIRAVPNVSVDGEAFDKAKANLTKEHETAWNQLQAAQSMELSDIKDSIDQEERRDLDEIEMAHAQEVAARLQEKRAQLDAEFRVAGANMSEAEKDALLRRHEKEMNKLEDALYRDKERQQDRTRARLAERRRQKMRELERKHDLENRRELEHQNEEKTTLYENLQKEAENEAIRVLVEDGDNVHAAVELVLDKRHQEQQNALMARHMGERSLAMRAALDSLEYDQDLRREALGKQHDSEMRDLLNKRSELGDDEFNRSRIDMLNRQQMDLRRMEEEFDNEIRAAEKKATNNLDVKHAKERLDLREAQLQEIALTCLEVAPQDDLAKRRAEDAIAEADAIVEYRKNYDSEIAAQLAGLEKDKESFEEELRRRKEEEMAALERELEAERLAEEAKNDKVKRELMEKKQRLLREKEDALRREANAEGEVNQHTRDLTLTRHEKELEALESALDGEMNRQLSRTSDKLRQKREARKQQRLAQIDAENSRLRAEKAAEVDRKREEVIHAQPAVGVASAVATPRSTSSRRPSVQERTALSHTGPAAAAAVAKTAELLASQRSDNEWFDLLMSSPLYGKLVGIEKLLAEGGVNIIGDLPQQTVAPAPAIKQDYYIDQKDAGWVCRGPLAPVDVKNLSCMNFVVYKFGLYVIDLLALHNQFEPISLLVASELPPNNFDRNAYRNSFHYDVSNRTLFIRQERLENVGEFILVLAHCLAHVKVKDMSDDTNPAFLRQFYRSLKVCCEELFFARAKKSPALDNLGTNAEDGGRTALESVFARVKTTAEKKSMVNELLDTQIATDPSTQYFSKENLKKRIEAYGEFQLSSQLSNYLVRLEDNVGDRPASGANLQIGAQVGPNDDAFESFATGQIRRLEDDVDKANTQYVDLIKEIQSLNGAVKQYQEMVEVENMKLSMMDSVHSDEYVETSAKVQEGLALLRRAKDNLERASLEKDTVARQLEELNGELSERQATLEEHLRRINKSR